jgi:two-component system, LytTR family, response regulator
MKIRTLIVDDEPLARTNLAVLLQRDPQIEIIGECGSSLDAPDLIRRTQPDLLFLDVQMPERDGFDVLELLGSAIPSTIVFVTAFDQYAIRAFDAGALDYLLKPFDNTRFERTLDRAKEKITLGADRLKTKRLAIKSAGQIAFISLPEIDWIEAADYYAALHIGSKTHLLRRSMAELEQDLDPSLFCRVHRSAIVNLDRVRSLKLNEDGDYTVLLTNNTTLRLSRRYRKHLQSRLGLSVAD